MDPRRLLTFRAVAREGSFSKGARALHLSQPSVSLQIAQLEAETGTRLFDRGRGGTRLTAAGELLLSHADHVAWRLDLAARQLSAFNDEQSGRFVIGAFPTALAGLVPEALALVKVAHPDLQVIVSETTHQSAAERVLRGDLDLAIGYQDAAEPPLSFVDAERFPLMQETFLMAMAPGHPLAGDHTPVPLSRFADDEWVVPSLDGFVIRACRRAGFEPKVLSVSSDPLAMTGLVTRGLAVALVPSLLAHAYGGAVLRPVEGAVPRRDVFALAPPHHRHPRLHDTIAALRAASDRMGSA